MDIEDISHGKIPWNKKGFQVVNEELSRLLSTPKDDWDLHLESVFLKGLDQEGIEFKPNPFQPMGQISNYMKEMYADKKEFMAHFFRYNNMIRFLKEYEQELMGEGLIKKGSKFHMIKDELLDALCEMPFTLVRESLGDFEDYYFDYDAVVDKAWERLRKNEGTENK